MPETISRSGAIIPVEIRTARTEHPCNDCPEPIMPRGRKHDAELCCGRHLASTVTALAEGQPVGVTVAPVHAHTLELLRG
jgi:hypothetical protein